MQSHIPELKSTSKDANVKIPITFINLEEENGPGESSGTVMTLKENISDNLPKLSKAKTTTSSLKKPTPLNTVKPDRFTP